MRVFVSFNGADRPVKNKLVEILERETPEDVEIWDGDKFCISSFSGECIDAIDASQVFIVLTSAASMSPASYVLSEVIEARKCEGQGLLNIIVFSVDDTPLTAEFRMNLNHISDANRLARAFGDAEGGYAIVVKRVNRLLKLRKEGRPELPNQVGIPELDAVVRGPLEDFVEGSRDDVYKKLHTAFGKSNVVFLEQLNGFGRKSTARKYAEVFSNQFKKVYYFPFFQGSLRAFLLEGLSIKNLNESVFQGLEENEILTKKLDLLNKLDAETILIVPEIIFDRKDDQFVFDILSSVKCRIIFITQKVNPSVKAIFPCVFEDRMDDQSLLELFFHYYECNEHDRETLKDSLIAFFSAVGGHTKTVELTAATISEEWGVYPEEVPAILKNITGDKPEGLAGVVSDAISNLFGLNEFDELQRKILWCAAVCAQIPVDEKKFVDLLRNAGCFDSEVLRSLSQKRWIDVDRSARLISMDRFLATVCLAKIQPDQNAVRACSELISDCVVSAAISMAYRSMVKWYLIGSTVLSRLGMPGAAEACRIACQIFCSSDPISKEADINKLRLLSASIEKEKKSSAYSDAASQLLFIAEENTSSVPAMNKDGAELLAAISEHLSSRLSEDSIGEAASWPVIENIRKLMARFSLNPQNALPAFLYYMEVLLKGIRNYSTEEIEVVEPILVIIFRLLDPVVEDYPYFQLQICRLRERFAEATGGFYSEAEVFHFCYTEFKCLYKLNAYDEETHDCYKAIRKNLAAALEESTDGIGALEMYTDASRAYIDILSEHKNFDEAENTLRDLFKLEQHTDESLKDLVGAAKTLALSLIGKGDSKSAAAILHDVRGLGCIRALRRREKTLGNTELLEDAKLLADMLAAIEAPPEELNGDGYYSNYYATYTVDTDRRHAARCREIAKKALEIDYSGLDSDGLRKTRFALEKRARNGERIEKLAPEAFALVSETGYRILGYRHHYVQFLGAASMIGGGIAEIQNGEGKTYTMPLVAFLYTLYGKQVHILEESEYLCRRNYGWMRGVYEALGCRVGFLSEETRREKDAFRHLSACSVIYAVFAQDIFVFLSEQCGDDRFLSWPLRREVLLVDEADYLVDKADQIFSQTFTNLTFSDDRRLIDRKMLCQSALQAVDLAAGAVDRDRYFTIEGKTVNIGEDLYAEFEHISGLRYAQLSPGDKHTLDQALRCCIIVQTSYEKGRDYFLKEAPDKDGIRAYNENTKTGMLESFAPIFEYYILLKEGVPEAKAAEVLTERRVADSISLYSFVHLFETVCGATATASSTAHEFEHYYGLRVSRIPTNRPVIRREHPPMLFQTAEQKEQEILNTVSRAAKTGQPVLVVCENTYETKRVYSRIRSAGIKATLLNVENAEDRPEVLADAGRLGAVTVTTALANRGVDICLGGNNRLLAKKELIEKGIDPELVEQAIYGAYDRDEESAELRNKYTYLSVLWNVRLAEERKKAEELGGLCVIGTTCFPDLRTEQQLIGRCGRQGCPGESHIFYSLVDPSFSVLLGDNAAVLDNMFSRLQVENIECTRNSFLGKAVGNARAKIQRVQLSGADDTCDVLCIQPLRDRMHMPFFELYRGKEDLAKTLRRIIASAPGITEKIKKYQNGKTQEGIADFLRDFIREQSDVSLRRIDIPEKLADYILRRLQSNWSVNQMNLKGEEVFCSNLVCAIAKAVFLNAWEDYMDSANLQFISVRSQRNRTRLLQNYVESYGRESYEKAVEDFLRRIVTVRSSRKN